MESLNDYKMEEITRAQYKAIVEIVNTKGHDLKYLYENLLDYTMSIPNIINVCFSTEDGGKNKVKVQTVDSIYYFKLEKTLKQSCPNEV